METKSKKQWTKIVNFFINNKILVILIVLVIGMSIASDAFLKPSNIINVIRQISTSAMIGLGFTLVLTAGDMDLSVGTLLGMIGVIMAKMSLVMPTGIAIVLGILIAGVCGYFTGALITKLNLNGFIVTLAMQSIYKGSCYLICNNAAVTGLSDTFKFFGQGYVGAIPIPIVILVVMMIIVFIIIYRTKFGRYVVAIGGGREAARASGINIGRVRRLVFAIMGLFCGVGALIMTGRLGSAQQSAGQGMEMDAIAATVLGGTAMSGGKPNVIGTVLGCLTVGIINNGLNLAHLDTNWQIVGKGVLIIIAIILDSQTEKIQRKLGRISN